VRHKFAVNSTAELRATHGEVGPVAGAQVQVYDRKFTNSGADVRYRRDNVPLGSYLLKSFRVIDGILYSGRNGINLNAADLVEHPSQAPQPTASALRRCLSTSGAATKRTSATTNGPA
jgi:hypothetical protein